MEANVCSIGPSQLPSGSGPFFTTQRGDCLDDISKVKGKPVVHSMRIFAPEAPRLLLSAVARKHGTLPRRIDWQEYSRYHPHVRTRPKNQLLAWYGPLQHMSSILSFYEKVNLLKGLCTSPSYAQVIGAGAGRGKLAAVAAAAAARACA